MINGAHILHIVWHALLDSIKLLPFLFLTYLLMELLEHRAGERVRATVARAGRAGPLIGAGLGLFPQCGFSAAIAGLYAGRVVTLGTVVAVFLSTSDELIPIVLGSGVPVSKLATVLALKLGIALLAGFALDLALRRRMELHVEELCDGEHCHCERGIWRSALHHTLHIFVFILLFNLVLGAALELIGEARIGAFLAAVPVLGIALSALVGLIPNCAASVAIVTLWVEGIIPAGAMLAGSLTGAGAGLLVLLRTNRPQRENLLAVGILLGVGILCGCLLDLTGLATAMGL